MEVREEQTQCFDWTKSIWKNTTELLLQHLFSGAAVATTALLDRNLPRRCRSYSFFVSSFPRIFHARSISMNLCMRASTSPAGTSVLCLSGWYCQSKKGRTKKRKGKINSKYEIYFKVYGGCKGLNYGAKENKQRKQHWPQENTARLIRPLE